jgi:hypothetical protein
MRTTAHAKPTDLTAIERKRIIRRKQAAALRGESEDSVARNLRGKEVRLGARSVGYRVEDVLQLEPEAPGPEAATPQGCR